MWRFLLRWLFVVIGSGACALLGCGRPSSRGPDSTSSTPSVGSGGSSVGSGGSSAGSGGSGGGGAGSSITVSTTDQNMMPVPNVPVVVNNAAGAVVLVAQSGADGTIAASVPQGGAVSVFATYGLDFEVTSVLEPPDGATVHFLVYSTAPQPPPPAQTTFQVTATQFPAGTSVVRFYSCGQLGQALPSGSTATAALNNTFCTAQATSSFLAIACDSTGSPLAWGTLIDQPNSPGGVVNIQIAAQTSAFDTLNDTISGISSWATNADITVNPTIDGSSSIHYDASDSADMPASVFAGQLVLPHGAFTSYSVSETMQINADDPSSGVERQRVYANLPSSESFSADAMALVSVNPLDVSDPLHPRLTWSVTSGLRGDYAVASAQWGGGTATNYYAVYFPPDHTTSFRVPDIPPTLSSYAPTSTSVFSLHGVSYTDDERVTGYAQTSLFHDIPAVDGLGLVTSAGQNNTAASP